MSLVCIALLLPFPLVAAAFSWRCIIRYPSNWKFFLALFIYTVFVFSYIITPSYENDLTRYFQIIDSIRGLTLGGAVATIDNGLPIENFLFWVVATIGDEHLLPAVSASVVYGITAYITLDYARNEGFLEDAWMVLLLEVMQFSFFSITNNVRNVFTFSLVVLAAYRDLYKNKRDVLTLLLYILPCFMHKTGAVIVLIRILVIVVKRALPLVIGIIVFLPTAIVFLYDHRSRITMGGAVGRLLKKIIASAYNYLSGAAAAEYGDAISKSAGQNLIRLIVMMTILILGFLCYLYNKNCQSGLNTFCFLLCAVVLATNAFKTPAYWRFASAAVIASPPAVFWAVRHKDNMIRTVLTGYYGLALCKLFLDILFTRTRINFADFLASAFTTNIYTILLNVIRCLMR